MVLNGNQRQVAWFAGFKGKPKEGIPVFAGFKRDTKRKVLVVSWFSGTPTEHDLFGVRSQNDTPISGLIRRGTPTLLGVLWFPFQQTRNGV